MKTSLFFHIFPLLIFSLSCGKQTNSRPALKTEPIVISVSNDNFEAGFVETPDTLTTDSLEKLLARYDLTRKRISTRRQIFKSRLENAQDERTITLVLDGAGYYLQNMLADTLLPFWYGTIWDYHGYTDQPRDGTIACGYFVSTPLNHIGLNINRYKMAQQYSLKIVDLLCSGRKRYSNFEKMMTYIRGQPDDLYIVGLDNHVGFIRKKANRVDFIHASFVTPGMACTEPAEASNVLPYSTVFVLGHLTSNHDLVRKWLEGTRITVN